MLNDKIKNTVDIFAKTLSKDELLWVSGYLFGLAGSSDIVSNSNIVGAIDGPAINLTILYASETGNSKKLAIDLSKLLKKLGGKVKLKDISQYRVKDLLQENNLLLISSTHGEGEIPEPANKFYDNLLAESGVSLSSLSYYIIALGDSNYPLFCKAGDIFDELLTSLGGKKLGDTLKFDLDFESYIDDIYGNINSLFSGSATSNTKEVRAVFASSPKKNNKEIGEIIKNVILNDTGSNKEIHHIEIASDIKYSPGDALGIKIDNNTPRLYSIASSPNEHEGEVHLTVKHLEKGLCSGYLSRLKEGDKIEFYISPNNKFRLPDSDKDIIMIGAGTGIAPFRAFIAERSYNDAIGKNWLFFGEQYSHLDFLYQTEWQDYSSSDILTKISLAFSRDQKKKIYVQDKIIEEASEIKQWVENGAYIYICGDKDNMAKSVEKALLEICGESLFNSLEQEGRYLKDVY